MAIAFVQFKAASGTLPYTVTLDSAPTPGNILFAVVAQQCTVGVPATPSASGWSLAEVAGSGAAGLSSGILARPVLAGDGTGWTFDSSQSGLGARICLAEFNGVGPYASGAGWIFASVAEVSQTQTLGISNIPLLLFGGASYWPNPPGTPLAGTIELDDGDVAGPAVGRLWAGYRIITGAADGNEVVGFTPSGVTSAYLELRVYEEPIVGVWIDWENDGFSTDITSDGSLARMMPEASGVSDDITADVIEFSWQRGGTPDLAGGVTPGSATIIVKNATKKYNPDNTGSSLYGKLRPGRPVWIGINGNGSMVETSGQTIHGMFAGRIREIAPQPLEQTCEIICDDPLATYRRVPVRLADSTTRSQAAYRLAIMGVIGEPTARLSLPAESAMLPLSSLDTTDALAALDDLNKATGTRHFVQPSGVRDTWYVYTARDRHYHLGTAADVAIDFGSDHVVSIDGYRVTEESIVNVQKATLSPISFPLGSSTVWTHAQVPLTVGGNVTIWANFADYVAGASLEVTSTGAAVTSTLTTFGATAKIELYSTGAQVQRLAIVGRLVIREQSVSVVAEDEPSKTAYGSRAGGEVTSDLFGSQAEAKGLADHTIWRFAQPLKRPAITLRGAPVATMLRELYDVAAVTSTSLSVAARRFDIVGISGTCRTATAVVKDLEVTWQLSESPLQTSRTFFIIGTSTIGGPDVIGY